MNSNNPKKLETKGIFFLVWFVTSIVMTMVLQSYNILFSLIAIGQMFLIMGLIIPKKGVKINFIQVIFVLTGLLLIIVPLLIYICQTYNMLSNINWTYLIVILGISSFGIFGLLLIIIEIINKKRLEELCNVPMLATVIRHDSVAANDGPGYLYCPVYGFEFNGKKYEVSNKIYTNMPIEKIGEKVEMKINPSNPEDFLIKERTNSYLFFIAIIFIIMSIIGLIAVVNNNPF